MADKGKLRDMLDAIIDDNDEKAQVDFHSYLTDKMKDQLNPPEVDVELETEVETEGDD